jgi:hypothetical protein
VSSVYILKKGIYSIDYIEPKKCWLFTEMTDDKKNCFTCFIYTTADFFKTTANFRCHSVGEWGVAKMDHDS